MGNELADSLAKEAAKVMIDSQEEFYGEADKVGNNKVNERKYCRQMVENV